MRVRERDNTATITKNNLVTLGPKFGEIGSSILPGTGDHWMTTGSVEEIHDIDGNFEDDNPCYHHSSVFTSDAGGLTINLEKLTGINAGHILTATLFGHPGTSMGTELSSFKSVHHPANSDPLENRLIPDYSAEGWYSIYPVIKNELNLVNSIYELKDFKMLPRLVSNTYKTGQRVMSTLLGKATNDTMRDLVRSMGLQMQYALSRGKVKEIPKYKKLSLSQLLQLAGTLSADHLLNWKFAVQPLLNDIAAVTDVAASLDRKVARLLERANGDIQKGHFLRIVRPDEYGLEPNDWSSAIPRGTGAGYYRVVNSVEAAGEYRLNVRYSFGYSEEARKFAYELGRLDALGLSANPAILWRATRWTFVLDWFIKIGPMLDRLQPHNLEPLVHIHGGSESLKYSYSSRQVLWPYWPYIAANPSIAWGNCEPHTCAKVTTEVYLRKRRIPSLLGMPKTSDFSSMEKLLALALAGSAGGYHTG